MVNPRYRYVEDYKLRCAMEGPYKCKKFFSDWAVYAFTCVCSVLTGTILGVLIHGFFIYFGG